MSIQRVRAPHGYAQKVVSPSRLPTPTLPPWESFPTGDRQRLVRAILQAAQRQVTTARQREESDPEPGR